jgi:hypothetical protein
MTTKKYAGNEAYKFSRTKITIQEEALESLGLRLASED